MAANDLFRFDYARYRAATELRSEHISDFQRLIKTLRYGSRFQLLFAEFTEADYRDTLIRQIDLVFADLGQPVARIDLSSQGFADFAALEAELRRLATDHGAIHLTGVDDWFDEGRWRDFNVRREAIAFSVPVRLAIWLSAETMARAIVLAPDLWAWRGGVYAFTTAPATAREPTQPQGGPVDPRTLAERSRRIAVLRESLAAEPPPDDEILGLLLDELADLLASIGELDEALRIRREDQLPAVRAAGGRAARAVTQGKIADVLQARGELDEALRIRREDELPVYERLGDVRERAVTLGQIADVLQARGELDEALRIRREEELPVYERLGDVRSRAVTQGQIADVLQARGELDEALRIRREEQLPVYERLGDVRSRAVTLGKIADVLQARGELDEALRIRREEELPVYERLGDVRSRAVTQGKIADVLQARGELDEALRIRREEQLPVYERLGDVRERAVTQGKIADVLQARGELDEALRIRREDQLPVYERLQSVRDVLVCRAKIGINYLARGSAGDREKALELLNLALQDAQRLKLPEARQIAEIIQQVQAPPDSLSSPDQQASDGG